MNWHSDTRIEFSNWGGFVPADILDGTGYWEENEFPKRWPSFSFEELRCKGSGDLRFHYETLDKLQALRNLIQRPIIVNSYYRSVAYNTQVRGVPHSQHLSGKAVDTSTWPTLRGQIELVHAAGLVGFRGIGIYQSFTHLDTAGVRMWVDPSAMNKHLIPTI